MAIPGSAGGFALAEAFVRIRPDTDGFRRDADAQLKREMAGDQVVVPVKVEVDTSDARLKLGQLSVTEAITTPDPAKITAALEIVRNRMRTLGIADIADVNVDPGKIAQSLQRLKILIQRVPGGSVPGLADLMDINIPVQSITGQLERIKNILNKAGGQTAVADLLDVNLNTSQVTAGIQKIEKAFAALAPGETIPLGLSDPGVLNSINDVRKAIGSLESSSGSVVLPTAVFPPGELNQLQLFGNEIQQLKADTGGWNWSAVITGFHDAGQAAVGAVGNLDEWLASMKMTTSGLVDLDAELQQKPGDMDKAGGAAKNAGGNFSWFGGILGATIGHVALWHVALDAIVEGLLAVTLAAAAAATGIAALTPVAIDIYNHISAVNQVNSALGDQIPVLGAGFRNLAESTQIASQGVEIYGAAVNAVGNKTGILTGIARQVVTLFDDWAAKIVLWSNAQGGFQKLMQDGIGYLKQFGQLIGTLGQAFGNLLHEDPGIAHFLLDFLNAVAQLFLAFTKLPGPVVTAALALHALYVYGNFASGVLGKLVGFVPALAKLKIGDSTLQKLLSGGFSLGFVFTPLGASATVAAAGIGFLVYEMLQVPPAAQKAISAVNNALQLNPADFLAQFGTVSAQALQQLSVAVHTQQRDWVPYESAVHSSLVNAGKSVQDFAKLDVVGGLNASGNALTELGKAFVDFWTGSVHGQQEQNAIDGLNAGLKALTAGLSSTFQETGVLLRQGFSVSQSFALMGLAGVQAGDSFALMQQKVDDLLAGYKAMSIQGPILASSVNAVTFATEQQNSKVATLNSGWDAFFTTVTGGISDLYTFESSLKTLDAQAGVSTKGLGLLSTGAITTGQDFLQSAQGANQMADQITTMVSAAGLGAHGTDLITASVKDYVALLLPAARGSQAFTDILYSMAQRGGYTGANSFQALNQWVATASGSVKAMGAAGGPAQQLQGTMTTLTGDVGNLTTDVQNLATALHQTLTGAMAAAVLAADGGQKAFDDFATAIFTTGKNSTADIQTGTKLVDSLIKQTGSVQGAHDAFMLFAQQALHLTHDQATTLWNEIDAQLIPAVEKTGTTAVLSSQQISDTFLSTLTQVHNLSPQLDSDVSAFTTAVQKTGDTSTRTQGARAQLIRDLENAGYSAQVSAGLVDGLQQQIDGLHGKNVNFVMTGQGAGQLYFNATTGVGGDISGGLKFLAGGGSVIGPGGPTSDVIPIMASAGEYVINAASAKKLGLNRLNELNSYAGGGVVGGNFAAFAAGAGAGLNAAGNFIAGNELGWGEHVADNWATKVIAIVKAKVAAAAAAQVVPGGVYLGPGSNNYAADIATVLKQFGMPLSLVANWLTQIQTESGGSLTAVNLTDCLTIDAMILTRRGWLKHDEVQVGDETIGYNLETGCSEWTPVTRVVHYDDAPLVRIGNARWHAVTTPNHRWVTAPRIHIRKPELQGSCPLCDWPAPPPLRAPLAVCPECGWTPAAVSENGVQIHRGRKHGVPKPPKIERRTQRGRGIKNGLAVHLALAHGIRAERQESENAPAQFAQTQDIDSRDRLVLSAVADTGPGLPITTTEAAILGWVAGDGHVERNRRGASISIAQSKPRGVARLKALLADTPHALYTDERVTRTGKQACGPRHIFRFPPAYARDLMERAGHPKQDAFRQVLEMSAEQRRAWLDAFIDAEGHRDGGYVSVSQCYGPILDAAHLAIYLCGYRPRLVDNKVTEPGWNPAAHISACRPVVHGGYLKREDAGRGPVWCVTTGLGTWTAEQDGQVFLTGNSNALAGHPSVGLLQIIPSTYAAFSGPYRNTPPLVNYGGGPVSENAMAQIYTAIRYADIRYGGAAGMAAVIGHGHGYAYGGQVMDSGGWLPPGRSLVWNGTGSYEHLSRDSGQAGRAHATLDDVCAALEQLTAVSGSQGRAFASALNAASGGAAARGSYSTRR